MRKDLSIYNESLLFVIASKNLSERDCSQVPGGTTWNELVAEGIFLPTMLTGDSGINVRVVVNDDLTAEEGSEAASHFAARLRVRDGQLALVGGIDYLDGEIVDECLEVVRIPRGDYRADVYACFAGVNGPYLSDFQATELGEPLGRWFRRTRPDDEIPRWLSDFCRAHPESDPGYERLWRREADQPYFDPPEYLDFIVRLIPWNSMTAVEPPELDDNGCIVPMPIKPVVGPLGLALNDGVRVELR